MSSWCSDLLVKHRDNFTFKFDFPLDLHLVPNSRMVKLVHWNSFEKSSEVEVTFFHGSTSWMDTSGIKSPWDYTVLHENWNVNHQLGTGFWYIRESYQQL
jgi:hypothetical protein